MKLLLTVEISETSPGVFHCAIAPAGMAPAEAWGVGGEGRTMSEAFMQAAWGFEHLEEANPALLHKDYPALLLDIHSSSEYVPWRPPR